MGRPMNTSASFADPTFVDGNPNDPWSLYVPAEHDPPTRARTAAASRNTTTAASHPAWLVLVEMTPVTDTAPAAAVVRQYDAQWRANVDPDVSRFSVHPVGVVHVAAVLGE